MELSDIKKSISEMSDEELREHLGVIRQNRRTPKRAAPTARNTVCKSEASTEALVDAMTKEQIELLLRKMGG